MNFTRKREPESPRSVLDDTSRQKSPAFLLPFVALGGLAAALLHRRRNAQQEEVLVASSSGRYSGAGEIVLHGSAMAPAGVPVIVKTPGGALVPYIVEPGSEQQHYHMQQQQQYAVQMPATPRGNSSQHVPIGYSPQRVTSFGPAPVPSSMVLNIYTGSEPPPPVESPAPPPKQQHPLVGWLKQTGVVGIVSIAVWEIVRPPCHVMHHPALTSF